jgi:GT2 family glycosyltransferase
VSHETIVIDNGSTDETREVAHAFVKNHPETYKYYFEPNGGKSVALNAVIPHITGKILVFTDDDVIVGREWVQAIWDTFTRNENATAVQGRILLQEELGALPAWYDPGYLITLPYFDPSPVEYECDTLVGANMAIRREAFEKFGLFDPSLGVGASGSGFETEFCTRLTHAGAQIIYQPKSVVFHEFYKDRLTWDYIRERAEYLAYNHAYFNVTSEQKKDVGIRGRLKLARYYIKYAQYWVLHNQRKQYRCKRKITYLRKYMESIRALRESSNRQ